MMLTKSTTCCAVSKLNKNPFHGNHPPSQIFLFQNLSISRSFYIRIIPRIFRFIPSIKEKTPVAACDDPCLNPHTAPGIFSVTSFLLNIYHYNHLPQMQDLPQALRSPAAGRKYQSQKRLYASKKNVLLGLLKSEPGWKVLRWLLHFPLLLRNCSEPRWKSDRFHR